MISISPVWTSNLYVATFRQHLYMENTSLSWSYILGLVVPIIVAQSLVFYVVFCPFYFAIVLSVRFKSTDFDSPFGILKLFLRKRYICVTNDHRYVPAVQLEYH
jgi:hypothetical protein